MRQEMIERVARRAEERAATVNVPGTTFGGSSRNQVNLQLTPSSDKRTVGLTLHHVTARVSLAELVRLTQGTGGGLRATGGATAVHLEPKGNTIEISFEASSLQGLEGAIKVGRQTLLKALLTLGA